MPVQNHCNAEFDYLNYNCTFVEVAHRFTTNQPNDFQFSGELVWVTVPMRWRVSNFATGSGAGKELSASLGAFRASFGAGRDRAHQMMLENGTRTTSVLHCSQV